MKRRQWLVLGAGAAAALAVAGTAVAWWQPAREGGRLVPEARTMLAAVARAVLADLLPAEESALQAHLDRLQATIAGMPPAMQTEVDQLFTLLLTPPGRLGLFGLATPWPGASTEAVRDALQGLRSSRLALRQQVFHALRDLTNAAWLADDSTWAAIGYPGPREL